MNALIILRLEFPGFKSGDPPKATAIARNVRETPTQYVVNRNDVEITTNRSGVLFGKREARFSKNNGLAIPYSSSSWRVIGVVQGDGDDY